MANRRLSSQPQLRRYSIYPDRQVHFNEGLEVDDFTDPSWQQSEDSLNSPTYSYTDFSISPEPYQRKYSTALKVLKPFRPRSKDGKIPVNKAGFFSYVFMTWISPLIWKIFRHRQEALKEEDIWACSTLENANLNTERLTRIWKEEVEKRGPEKASFLRVWLKFAWTRIMVTLVIIALNAVSTFLESGYLLNLIVQYLESEETDLWYGVGLVASMAACQIIRATSFCVIIIFGVQTGVRFRAGLLGLAFDKMLRLKSVRGKQLSELITIFGADAYRVFLNNVTFAYLLALPIYVVIGAIYTYYLLGPWSFTAMGIFIFCYVVQARLTTVVAKLRAKTLKFTDKRVRKMTELINSMKLIKMYAWEKPFKAAIQEIRKREKKYLFLSSILNSISTAVIPVTPTLASVATIASYRAAGNELSASTAFSVVGTLSFLRVIVAFIPFATRTLGESKVSFARMKRHLNAEEYQAPSDKCTDPSLAVEITDATFIWDSTDTNDDGKKKTKKQKKEKTPTANPRRETIHIQNMTFKSIKGQLIGICGPVGCGKSAFISSIMGRISMVSGHLAVNGSVAYAAQQAWIFNGTLRDNILFGKPYDQERYQNVLFVCGLQPDLLLLPNGDETEIGDRGTNLSGGQKQRVSLARAVYSDSDIYLLDDVLSAVDVHVGRHLFHNCIKKFLSGKTVIFTTHQLQYLKHCDEILVMQNGVFVERGKHDSLISSAGYYDSMMKQFHQVTDNPSRAASDSIKQQDKDDEDQGSTPQKKVENGVQNGTSDKKPEVGKLHKDTSNKGKLTQTEEMQVGDITWGTYYSYISAMGGICVAMFVVSWSTLTSASVVFSDWWLSIWINTFFTSSGIDSSNSTTVQNVSLQLNYTDQKITSENPIFNTTISDVSDSSSGLDFYLTVYVSSMGLIILMMIAKGFIGATYYVRAACRLHDKVLTNVMKAPMRFFDANPPGRILNRFSKDLDEADVFLPQLQDTLFQVSTSIVVSLVSAVVIMPWIGIAIVPVAIFFYIFKIVSSVSVRQFKRFENITRSPLLSHVNTSAQGLSTIVSFQQQTNCIQSIRTFTDVSTVATFLMDSAMRWIGLRLDLAASCITLTTALSLILTKASTDAAQAALALTQCIKVVSVMQFMIRVLNEVEARFTSIERLHQYEKLESESQTFTDTPAETWPNEGRIIFSNVQMKYRDDMDPVLNEIRFDIHPRQKVGIVGRTGAGKSSLAAALFRLNELSRGHIYIDGVDIANVSLHLLRSKLSTIPQDPVLFAGTMRYNLDPFGQYTDEVMWAALEDVHMKDKVKQFDNELDYMIEENGENFSVGERQLICLARAILRRNKILLLDEATASIDTATDAKIQQTIRESFADCTVLTIAHRLNTVLHCDLIIIMDAGRVMEMGSPQDLLSDPNSYFNTMLSAQTVKTPSP
ncbi:ATP-binding cassette sub-family C member 5-like [Saccostrea echinata]|uniref:ATP-binding cassette sub-family C member 5-like n=1 Tax=Saccostrea echinata TaxID=191078 RepID=UPI002A83404E|nr:ATP-binding cassette sub-family C member 5-like [Saccostrea echinata]